MSEPEQPSDRIAGKSGRSVRTSPTFGQNHLKKRQKCPNQSNLRTESLEKAAEVSEPMHPSDRTT
ncbi:hypothetical protein ACFPA1_24485 [Neobacillus sp. GCM10023253]